MSKLCPIPPFTVMRRDPACSYFRPVQRRIPADSFERALEAFARAIPENGFRALRDGEMLLVQQESSEGGGNVVPFRVTLESPRFTRVTE